MDLKLRGKRALVTGSTAGIGAAIAVRLADEGARVIVNGRTPDAVAKAVAALKENGHADVVGFAGDVGSAVVAEDLARKHPDIDILVNNFAVFNIKAFEDLTDADWLAAFDANVVSGVRLARLLLPGMKRADWGRIIFISSESALQVPAEMIHYGVSKAAQIAAARGLAESLAGTGITVNSVLPGPTRTRAIGEFVEAMAKDQGTTAEEVEREFFVKMRPTSLIKRFASADEVASLVTYLASPLSSATTGSALRVDGGVVKSAF